MQDEMWDGLPNPSYTRRKRRIGKMAWLTARNFLTDNDMRGFGT